MAYSLPSSSSAPRLQRQIFLTPSFTPEIGLDEATALSEQREVNAGVRSTFSAVNSTLRSQGAAIRGLEELLKRALPEVDRVSKVQLRKAEVSSVDAVVTEVSRLADELMASKEAQKALVATLTGKFDAQLGQRAQGLLAGRQIRPFRCQRGTLPPPEPQRKEHEQTQ